MSKQLVLTCGCAATSTLAGGGVAPHAGGTNRGASRTASTVVFETRDGAGAASSGLEVPKEGEDQRKLPSADLSVAAQPRPLA